MASKWLVAFNGSPRGERGNTPLMMGAFLEGYAEATGERPELLPLVQRERMPEYVRAFADADAVFLGFPLYTDAMPGIVKAFIDALEPRCGAHDNPEILCLVQSGFPEAVHSRAVEAYLQQLAGRLGSRYVGTLVKPSGESTRLRPPERNAQLFARLRELGRVYAETGALDAKVLALLASPERFPFWLRPILGLFLRSRTAHFFWDRQLREHGAYERRFDRPCTEEPGSEAPRA
jgi:NAD(P)H-dependent FMN reductase